MRTDVSGWQVRLDEALIGQHEQSGAWQNKTIAELARDLAKREPQRVTHVFEGRSWTIGELVAEADSLAASLRGMGLRPGDVVTKVGDKPVVNVSQLLTAVAALKPQDKTVIGVQRGEKALELKVTVAQRPKVSAKRE